jgi:hypothetical protein
MSKLIPRAMIDVLRAYTDIALDAVGIDCVLYIPTDASYSEAEKLDVFSKSSDYSYRKYSAKVFINWSPNIYRLKKLGLFVEGAALPILAWFGNKAIIADEEESSFGQEVNIDVIIHSYFEIQPEMIPDNYKTTEQFEVLNPIIKSMHDAIIRQQFVIAPRRIKM